MQKRAGSKEVVYAEDKEVVGRRYTEVKGTKELEGTRIQREEGRKGGKE